MFRYLLNISYIGTPFRGAQRQVTVKNGRLPDPTTVQGQLELGLKKLHPVNEPAIVLSSRTDAGVHALHSTMHVDLERQSGRPFEPSNLTTVLNNHFTRNGVPIRVLKTYLVPNDFHCRHRAIHRTYVYRLGVLQAGLSDTVLHYLPIQEYNRSLIISSDTFDVNKLREAADIFEGYHDFRTFVHKSAFVAGERSTRRTLEKLEIVRTQPFCTDAYGWPSCLQYRPKDVQMYDVVLKSGGFLYRQVRRIVASLIAVAKGIVTPRDIKFMLEIPSHRSWNPKIKTAPAHGLYLCEVAYSQHDLETFKERLEDSS